mmetsp:Transcript_55616/g.180457  ORF Transcript_55616/g.180457 Transcript_55616/m.180457 type:complete len:218 (+) Transcript_55616:162-815(+)
MPCSQVVKRVFEPSLIEWWLAGLAGHNVTSPWATAPNRTGVPSGTTSLYTGISSPFSIFQAFLRDSISSWRLVSRSSADSLTLHSLSISVAALSTRARSLSFFCLSPLAMESSMVRLALAPEMSERSLFPLSMAPFRAERSSWSRFSFSDVYDERASDNAPVLPLRSRSKFKASWQASNFEEAPCLREDAPLLLEDWLAVCKKRTLAHMLLSWSMVF